MRISDWSSDVCSSDLSRFISWEILRSSHKKKSASRINPYLMTSARPADNSRGGKVLSDSVSANTNCGWRSEEHTSELQSLMRISYAVFCLKKKKPNE